MTRNPELEHEFNEGKPQEKPYIFTSVDMNALAAGGSQRRPNSETHELFGKLAIDGSTRTKLANWQRISIVAAIVAVLVGIWALLGASGVFPLM